jgi:hypothetical protein
VDSHDTGHRLLAVFLAGDLTPADAKAWDEHLLECERCWRAVREDRAGRQAARVLRQPAPPGLADRVTFAVEMAAAPTPPRQAHPVGSSRRRARARRRLRWQGLASAGAVAVAVAVTLLVFVLPGGGETGSVPAAVAAVARYAQAVPPPAQKPSAHPGGRATPVRMGRPVTVTAGGQRIVMTTWRLGGTEAVVAVSARPFSMPSGAQGMPGAGMAWSVRLGSLGLYCRNGPTSELVAAPVPATQLARLAAQLPLT